MLLVLTTPPTTKRTVLKNVCHVAHWLADECDFRPGGTPLYEPYRQG